MDLGIGLKLYLAGLALRHVVGEAASWFEEWPFGIKDSHTVSTALRALESGKIAFVFVCFLLKDIYLSFKGTEYCVFRKRFEDHNVDWYSDWSIDYHILRWADRAADPPMRISRATLCL